MYLKKNPNIVYSDLDSEVCLFNPKNGEYLTLNSTGSIIWKLLDEYSNFEEISNKLKEIFAVENTNYIRELKTFIEISQNFEIITIKE